MRRIKVSVSDDQSGYVVAIYDGTGHEAWYLSVKSVIANERAEAKVTELEETYKTTRNTYTYGLIKQAGV